jgi:hypothetical protein
MSKKTVKKNVTQKRDTVNPWEQAISDAERLIANLKNQIKSLRSAILNFKDMRDADEPWPGTVESPDQSGSQPSGG